jgi:hypothetical protein
MTVVHVQLVPVVPGAADDPVLVGRLGAGERETIGSLGFAADRDRAVTARAAARLELGRWLGRQPRLVPLLSSDVTGGRPVIRGTNIQISWSHSGSWVALSLARGRPVGVDIELLPEPIPVGALRRIGLRSMEDFVAREAAGKVTGQGLTTTWPSGVSVRLFEAPAGYLGAAAALGEDWSLELRPAELRDPPASASATAIGLWDITGAGSRRMLPDP